MKMEIFGLAAAFAYQGRWCPRDADPPPEGQWGVCATQSNLDNALPCRALARSVGFGKLKLKHRSGSGEKMASAMITTID